MITINALTKRYGTTVVVDDVDLVLPRGGVTSIVGPNGAGKSTLLSMVARLLPADAGTVLLDGDDVTRTPGRALARRLAVLRQDNHLAVRLTVRDLVALGRYPYSRGRTTADDLLYVETAMEQLDVSELADRHLDELSGGQRQRAFVAMVLAQDTDYVLLDEPLNNLDMTHARDMMRTVRRAADELGRTIVTVLHDINFASCWSDHIVAMRDGRIEVQGPPSDVVDTEVLRRVYGTTIPVHEVGGQRLALYYS